MKTKKETDIHPTFLRISWFVVHGRGGLDRFISIYFSGPFVHDKIVKCLRDNTMKVFRNILILSSLEKHAGKGYRRRETIAIAEAQVDSKMCCCIPTKVSAVDEHKYISANLLFPAPLACTTGIKLDTDWFLTSSESWVSLFSKWRNALPL